MITITVTPARIRAWGRAGAVMLVPEPLAEGRMLLVSRAQYMQARADLGSPTRLEPPEGYGPWVEGIDRHWSCQRD